MAEDNFDYDIFESLEGRRLNGKDDSIMECFAAV